MLWCSKVHVIIVANDVIIMSSMIMSIDVANKPTNHVSLSHN